MTTETFYSLTNQYHQCVIIFFSLEGLNHLIVCPDQKIELKDFKGALIEQRFSSEEEDFHCLIFFMS